MRHVARLFLYLLLAAVIAGLAVFAVSNRAMVRVSFWPLPWEPLVPVYAAVLGAAAIGLLAGYAVCWWSKGRLWLRARASERRAGRLEAAAARSGATAAPASHPAPPALPAARPTTPPGRMRAAVADD